MQYAQLFPAEDINAVGDIAMVRRMDHMNLPGLDRLVGVCQHLELELLTELPSRAAPAAGALVCGLPRDPVLAAFYERMGKASFAADVAGIIMAQCSDTENKLEVDNTAPQQNLWVDEACGSGSFPRA